MAVVVTPMLTVTTGTVSMWQVTPAAIVSAKDTSMVGITGESTLLFDTSSNVISRGTAGAASIVSVKPP